VPDRSTNWSTGSRLASLGYTAASTIPPTQSLTRLPGGVDRVYELNGTPVLCFASFSGRREKELSAEMVTDLQQKVWNTARPPLLVIDAPDGVAVLNAYAKPRDRRENESPEVAIRRMVLAVHGAIDQLNVASLRPGSLDLFGRESIDTGETWRAPEMAHFHSDDRADRMLLRHIQVMRQRLQDGTRDMEPLGTSDESLYRLLTRLIFVRYLQQRQVNLGGFTQGLAIEEVVTNRRAYDFFHSLSTTFNGDMFPASDEERSRVEDCHLRFIWDGLTNVDPQSGQGYLFDLDLSRLPVELLSGVYDEFITPEQRRGEGAFYTRPALAEFILGETMPIQCRDAERLCQPTWRVLDPACGSGVFLVQAYRRLLKAWMRDHGGTSAPEPVARTLLSQVYGIDTNPIACRIAAFSLNLAFFDHLEQSELASGFRFPQLLDRQILTQDFMDTNPDSLGLFDRVVGNPPWGRGTAEQHPRSETRRTSGKNRAHSFLWYAPKFCAASGEVALLAPAVGTTVGFETERFRSEFFRTARVRAVVDASGLRRTLHAGAISPTVALFYRPEGPPDSGDMVFATLRSNAVYQKLGELVLDDPDIHVLRRDELSIKPWLWNVARWGTSRDSCFVEILRTQYPSLKQFADKHSLVAGEGLKVGGHEVVCPPPPGVAIRTSAIYSTSAPAGNFYPYALPHVDEPPLRAASATESHHPLIELETLPEGKYLRRPEYNHLFSAPFVICHHTQHECFAEASRSGPSRRIRAALVQHRSLIYRHSMTGIAGSRESLPLLKWLVAVLNSPICSYYLFLTSSRWTVERGPVYGGEVLSIPIPEPTEDGLVRVAALYDKLGRHIRAGGRFDDSEAVADRRRLDAIVYKAYEIREHESWLIDDTVEHLIPLFHWGDRKPSATGDEQRPEVLRPATIEDMKAYAAAFTWSMSSWIRPLGRSMHVEIYVDGSCPLFLSRFILHSSQATANGDQVRIVAPDTGLRPLLYSLSQRLLEGDGDVWRRRHVRLYEAREDGGTDIWIIHPPELRFWLRSRGMEDGDKVIADWMSTGTRTS